MNNIIRNLLREKNLNQRELADRLGTDQFYVSKLLNGKMPISPDIAVRLEEVLPPLSAEQVLIEQACRLAQTAREKRAKFHANADTALRQAVLKHLRESRTPKEES